MTVPWTGFPLSQLLKIAEPLGSAKYIVLRWHRTDKMPAVQLPFYPWPYIEGLTMDEAANELAFVSTGLDPQAVAAAERRANPGSQCHGSTVQVLQGVGQDQFHREAAGQLLAGDPAVGVWLLGQCEPRRCAPPLEPGARAAAGEQTRWCQRRSTMAMVSSSPRFTATGKTRNCSCDDANVSSPGWPPCCWSQPTACRRPLPPAVPLGQMLFLVDHDLMDMLPRLHRHAPGALAGEGI